MARHATKCITVYNNKGGVGKTHLCVNLATIYAMQKKRVLFIDLDPQANATHFLMKDRSSYNITITNILDPDGPVYDLREAIYPSSSVPGLDIVPADNELDDSETQLLYQGFTNNTSPNVFRLSDKLKPVRKEYDYIIIDTHPSKKRLLNLNALTASDCFFCPVDSDPESFEGLNGLIETYKSILDCNPKLIFGGVIYMRFRETNADYRALSVLSETLAQEDGSSLLLDTIIPLRTKAVETRWAKSALPIFAPKDDCTKAYYDLADEIERRIH